MILYVIEVATVNVENAKKKGKIKKNKEREIECRKKERSRTHKKNTKKQYMRSRNYNTVKSVVI